VKTITRRWLLRSLPAGIGALVVSACAVVPGSGSSTASTPPIVFVHGNGDSAALWQTTLWHFETNGWPTKHLHAIDLPYPLARDVDAQSQPGRTSTSESAEFLKREVDKVLLHTGASKVVLMGNSRGGYAIRNYIENYGGAGVVSHAVLGGTPNHGVWATKGLREGNEFSGTGPFLTALNTPKNAQGDEVTGPVKWLTIRSDNNDKFAQPDGLWIGAKGTPTNVTFDGPALKGATNVVLPGADHRETSFSPGAFAAAYAFITGKVPLALTIAPQPSLVLNGKLMGSGLNPLDAASGNFVNNLALPGAQLSVYATDAATGARSGAAVHTKTTGPDGMWGPMTAAPAVQYEFVIQASGYATTHIYRSAFARSSSVVHLRAERLPEADTSAVASITLTRPRGYFDAQRDRMVFDGSSALPGVPSQGAGVSSAKLLIKPVAGQAALRPVSAEFNKEKLTGLAWPAAENHLVVLELTY
jgi:pimeloyl-ACP methyl ester carboxylesterase